ncbi:DUF4231 domain-containing protein [Kitasatospora sp. NPDC002040]|uniref:DUF4231 domain-containing protein n=1 Tax=Kitasatospora sp. NPDC002040 TaxID=3154661 RepID=UPI003316E707
MEQQEAATENELGDSDLRRILRQNRLELQRRRTGKRRQSGGCALALIGLAGGITATIALGDVLAASTVYRTDGIAAVLVVAGLVVAWVAYSPSGTEDDEDIIANIATVEEILRETEISRAVPLEKRQRRYQADASELVRRYQDESRKYRRTHNLLQSTVIIGSLLTTAFAALGDALPGQRWITVGVSLAVGLSAGFTGYFKFRDRSFYLQVTADDIEEEMNAANLGIGSYSGLTEAQMLSLYTERVEQIRGDQRKRQQQLDQPAENQPPLPPTT